ncbi:MAG: hypothetical protein Q8L72_02525 [Moraxellaceae bacterium]|nr:hypothetical protein [Moraxellaceae bacterium]
MIKTIARIQLTDNDQSFMMAYHTQLPFVLPAGACVRLDTAGEIYVIKDVFFDSPLQTLDILFEPMNFDGSVKQHMNLNWFLEL